MDSLRRGSAKSVAVVDPPGGPQQDHAQGIPQLVAGQAPGMEVEAAGTAPPAETKSVLVDPSAETGQPPGDTFEAHEVTAADRHNQPGHLEAQHIVVRDRGKPKEQHRVEVSLLLLPADRREQCRNTIAGPVPCAELLALEFDAASPVEQSSSRRMCIAVGAVGGNQELLNADAGHPGELVGAGPNELAQGDQVIAAAEHPELRQGLTAHD